MRQAIINQWGKIWGSAEAWEYHPHQVSRAVGGLNPLSTASPQALAQCLRTYRILRLTNPSFLPFVFSLALHRLKTLAKLRDYLLDGARQCRAIQVPGMSIMSNINHLERPESVFSGRMPRSNLQAGHIYPFSPL